MVLQPDLAGAPTAEEIADAPETCTIYPELFTYIDRACPRWIYPSANQRLSMQLFWQEIARRTWAKDRMPFIEERLLVMSMAERQAHPNNRALKEDRDDHNSACDHAARLP